MEVNVATAVFQAPLYGGNKIRSPIFLFFAVPFCVCFLGAWNGIFLETKITDSSETKPICKSIGECDSFPMNCYNPFCWEGS